MDAHILWQLLVFNVLNLFLKKALKSKTEKREVDAIREPHFSQSQYSEQPFTMR